MSKETYNLVLNSQTATNRIGSKKRNYQYYINWNSLLPNKYKKVLVNFSFFTLVSSSFAEMYILYLDFDGSNVYSQSNSRINYVGNLLPTNNLTNATAQTTVGTTTQISYFYIMTRLNDDPNVTIQYPNNNLITVDIVNANSSSGTTFNYEYILNIQFIPIED